MTQGASELGLTAKTRVLRAAGELAAARPVIVESLDGARLLLAGEHLTSARLGALRQFGVPNLALSHHRAAHLRLRLYSKEAVWLSVQASWDAAFLLSLVDPARDLDSPLHGPLTAERDELPAAMLAGFRLARFAGVLPAVIGVRIDNASALASHSGFELIDAGLIPDPAAFDDPGPLDAEFITQAKLPIASDAHAQLIAFRAKSGGLWGEEAAAETHYALAIGAPDPDSAPLVRLHSECFTGDLLGSLKCDCGDQLKGAIERIGAEGSGLLLYLRQEGRGIGLLNKLRAYHLQDEGIDTVDANERLGFAEDERSFRAAARMLEAMGFKRIRLLTNNPRKVEALKAAGLEVSERVGHKFPANPHNAHYLATKRAKSGHYL